ncbi:D-alanyl-D-alanine carboxypeptidase [Actinocrispum wychmicini]|uniref:D-alanyl-D-alanine carboxypeptidase n=2 Tax=Actinocrispum wychmicini TaxID=1213861 RepID=A0A4R2J8C4_9PSEU|nr:D-alanyl-D-alanine carboxypeptidase [Actinocrispum wychmicini]
MITPSQSPVQQAMAELVALGVTGVQVRMHTPRGDWTGSAGSTRLGDMTPPPTDGRFRAGSVTKTVVSTVVLQLVDDGRIGLDAPVDQYLPEFALDHRITVRMLLQHTSGIFNYTGEPGSPGIPMTGQPFLDARWHTYRPADLVRLALAKPALFEPGTSFSYSNTDYVLAGLLIEKVTGTRYATQVEQRILRPLGMRATFLPGSWPFIPGPHAHGYFRYEKGVVDITALNPSWAFSAGEMISTTHDLDTFLAALLGGRLLSPAMLTEMRKPHPVSGYGLGLSQFDAGAACGGTVVGHSGSIHGYSTAMYGTADGRMRFEMSVTAGATEIDPTRFAMAESKVLGAAFCGNATVTS